MTTRDMQGLVAQAESDPVTGEIRTRFVPWWEAEAIGTPGERTGPKANRLRQRQTQLPSFPTPPPIVKRTPQERLNDLTGVLVKQYQEWGFLPESILQEIQGLYWASGQPMSVDELLSVEGEYLRKAEAESRRK